MSDPHRTHCHGAFLTQLNAARNDPIEKAQADNNYTTINPTHTSDITRAITSVFEERIYSQFLASGSVAWYRHQDGNVYEIIVSPADLGQHINVLKNKRDLPDDLSELDGEL